MNIQFENSDKINGLMTITVEEADYKENVEKSLKDYRKRANYPGFRPGMVPMGLIKKQYGTAIKMDAINKLVGEQIYNYVKENKIEMLGEPLPSEKQNEAVDLEKPAPYTFVFDIAVAPEFKIELGADDKVDYYTIKVDDKLIDQQVEMYASRAGEYGTTETYDASKNDMLKGDLRELDAEGNTKEGGITVEGAVLMPEYIKVEDQQKLFDGAKLGDIITFNPRKAYPEGEAEISSLLKIDKEVAKDLTADFSYQVTEISRFEKAPVDQKMFDAIYGEGTVKSEEEFRQHIAADIERQLVSNSDYKFLTDLRAYAEKKVGELTYPEALLKRVMLLNNKDKGEEYVEKNFAGSLKQLTWHLIKEQLVAAQGIKIEDDDVKAVAKQSARMQFAQYGMNNVPEEYLDNYVGELLKKRENIDNFVDRAVDFKLTTAYKAIVSLEKKEVSLDEFQELLKA